MYSYLNIIKLYLSAWWTRESFVFLSRQNAVNQNEKVPAGCQTSTSALFPEIKTNFGLGLLSISYRDIAFSFYHFCFLLFSHFNLVPPSGYTVLGSIEVKLGKTSAANKEQ
jgi:hypothetical protein